MGWLKDGADDHEGWVADLLADGRAATSSVSGGVIVHQLTADDIAAGRQVRHYPGTDHLDVVIGWDQVVAWQVRCQCGWTGTQRTAYDDPTHGTRSCPKDVEERVFAPAWDAHIAAFTALADLAQLLEEHRGIEARITDKVRRARAGGASWTQIGRAAGLSKQSAQQRWGQT